MIVFVVHGSTLMNVSALDYNGLVFFEDSVALLTLSAAPESSLGLCPGYAAQLCDCNRERASIHALV